MPPPQGLVSYPGIKQIVAFQYTLEHGISPGVATITCIPQKGWPAKRGDLVMTYGGTSLVLKRFAADSMSFQYDQSGLLWRLRLLDRRVDWRFGQISAVFNARLPHGPIDKLDPRTDTDTIKIIEILLQRMGETNYHIAKATVPELRPSLHYEVSNPAQELASLCDTLGLRVVLGCDNRVYILPKGKGGPGGYSEPKLPDGPVIFDSGTFDPPEQPAKIRLVLGGTRTEVDMYIEPVGDDIDGLVKPINDLSFKPDGGWENQSDFVSFRNIPRTPNNVDINLAWNTMCNPRELAKQSIYKKYRATIYTLNGNRITPPGFKEKLDDIRQLLPLGTQLIEPTFDPKTGWYRPVYSVVWGAFARGIKNNHEVKEIETKSGKKYLPIPIIKAAVDPVTGQQLPKYDTTVVPQDDYQIDPETGVLTFNRRYVRYEHNDDPLKQRLLPAVLMLRIAVTVNHKTDFTVLRHYVDREMPNPASSRIAYVRDDDLFVRYVPVHYNKGDHSTAIGVKDNKKEVKRAANLRLNAEQRKYQLKGPRHIKYAGWMKINPDGGIQQVSWSLSQAGAFTDAALNDEIAVITIPYAERRFLEKYNNIKQDALLKATDQLASTMAYPFSRASGLRR